MRICIVAEDRIIANAQSMNVSKDFQQMYSIGDTQPMERMETGLVHIGLERIAVYDEKDLGLLHHRVNIVGGMSGIFYLSDTFMNCFATHISRLSSSNSLVLLDSINFETRESKGITIQKELIAKIEKDEEIQVLCNEMSQDKNHKAHLSVIASLLNDNLVDKLVKHCLTKDKSAMVAREILKQKNIKWE